MKALLELRCIPAGMEMFPAANDEQWRLIQRVIDESDYYVVIVAGRYGSVDKTGMSYTEKEYRYALQQGIPIYGFVHPDPGKIAVEKLEKDPKRKRKLDEFRKLVESKMVKYWTSAEGLGGAVSRAISIAEKDEPRDGWVRGDKVLTEEHVQQVLSLQKEVKDLQTKLEAASGPPPGAESLAQGDDIVVLHARGWRNADHRPYDKTGRRAEVQTTWNDIFRAMSPLLASQLSKSGWKQALEEWCLHVHNQQIVEWNNQLIETTDDEWLGGGRSRRKEMMELLVLPDSQLSTIIVQFRALGLIRPRGGGGGFVLTEYGDRMAMANSAIRKS